MYSRFDGSSLSLFRTLSFVRYEHVGRRIMEDEVGGGDLWRLWGRREIYIQDFGGGNQKVFERI